MGLVLFYVEKQLVYIEVLEEGGITVTNQEYLDAKEKTAMYEQFEVELDKIDSALKNINLYHSFTLNTRTAAGAINFGITNTIRNELIGIIQNYRDLISGQMEDL